MSIFGSASVNGQSGAVGSSRCAAGAAADSRRGLATLAQRRHSLVGSPEGREPAASAGTGFRRVGFSACRRPGRASGGSRGAAAANDSSTANKSLKYVPALRASTGRS